MAVTSQNRWEKVVGETVISNAARALDSFLPASRLLGTPEGILFEHKRRSVLHSWGEITSLKAEFRGKKFIFTVNCVDGPVLYHAPLDDSTPVAMLERINSLDGDTRGEENKTSPNASASARQTSRSNSGAINIVAPSQVQGAETVANFFIGSAWFTLIVGFITGLVDGYNSTHIRIGGTSYAVPGSGLHGPSVFMSVFGLACLGAATLAFFGYALRLLKGIYESQKQGKSH